MDRKYDFSGWATKNNLRCSDGRIIGHNAFEDNDGNVVPLVWNHDHNDPSKVLGHALLENREQGVYAYASFNDSEAGKSAKTAVEHGDVKSFSIYANNLIHDGSTVTHGVIREVSLVLAGANPGALIDTIIRHGEECYDEAIIHTGDGLELVMDMEEKEVDEESDELSHAEEDTKVAEEKKEKTVEEIINTMNEEQKELLYGLVGMAAAGELDDSENKEGDNEMKHNVFDTDTTNEDAIMHSNLNTVFNDAKKFGSLRESYLQHKEEYGIENLNFINTEDKNYYDRPQFISTQPSGWIATVMAGVHHTPFDKVRTIFADITEDEARAKGYIKGKYKKEEVFKLLKRSVSATTFYKKQKFDRDDLVDADFDILPWVKSEMEIKFNEEKARAYLFGDGRSAADEDKIDEGHIIPVVADEDLFALKIYVTPGSEETLEHALIDAIVLGQDDYQGSGNLTAFIESKQVSRMLLMEDKFGHRLYKGMGELATAMGVNKIEKVPASVIPEGILGVVLDLNDYNVGQKNLGRENFFEAFDIDYNQQKYLLEARQSGALTRPYSAMVFKLDAGESVS